MEVISQGPLATGSLVWRSRSGALGLTVVAKGTFALRPGISPLASAQLPLLERDELAGVDPARWVRAPADLVPYKVRSDVVLVGCAHAADGGSTRQQRVRFAGFGVDKALDVFCDRRVAADGRVLEGAPFTQMPIGWDRAQESALNPAGIPPTAAPDLYGTVPMPNVAWPDVRRAGSAPAGLGPVAPWWPGRREKLGRRGLGALRATWSLAAVPDDADDAMFQVAPPDQQVSRLDLESVIYLEGLHAAHAQLTTRLAQVAVRAAIERVGRPAEPLSLVADTVWIDAERAVCAVTWRGVLGLVTPEEAGTVRVWSSVTEEAAAPPATKKPAFDPRETAAVDPNAALAALAALPFDRGARAPESEPRDAAPRWDPRKTAAVDPAVADARSAPMPFTKAPEGAPPPSFGAEVAAPAPRRPAFDPRTTSAVDPDVARAALAAIPFGPRPSPRPPQATFDAPAHYSYSNDPVPPAMTHEAPVIAVPEEPSASLERAPFDVAAPAWLGPVAAHVSAPAEVDAGIADEVTPPAWLGPQPPPKEEASGIMAPAATTDRRAELERRHRARESLDGLDASGLSLAGICLDGASLVGASFADADLSGASLRGATLTRANLTRARLAGGDLSGASLAHADATDADLSGAILAKAKLQEATLRAARLCGADLTEARLDGAALDGADLTKVKGKGAIGDRASLRGCSAKEADLTSASLAEAELGEADFTKSQLAKASLRGARCERTSFEGAQANGARLVEVWGPSAIFTDTKLEGATLRGARLPGARFGGATLRRAVMDGADLSNVDLARADLARASLRDVTLTGASLRGAIVDGADLRGADLSGVNATGATFAGAKLDGVRRDGAEGL